MPSPRNIMNDPIGIKEIIITFGGIIMVAATFHVAPIATPLVAIIAAHILIKSKPLASINATSS